VELRQAAQDARQGCDGLAAVASAVVHQDDVTRADATERRRDNGGDVTERTRCAVDASFHVCFAVSSRKSCACVTVWSPSVLPSATMWRSMSGYSVALCPVTKKIYVPTISTSFKASSD
jgi:hypothetical protein